MHLELLRDQPVMTKPTQRVEDDLRRMTCYFRETTTSFTQGFDPANPSWWWSMDTRTTNLEHMYVTTILALTSPTTALVKDLKKALEALHTLIRQDSKNEVGLPNWSVAILLFYLTKLRCWETPTPQWVVDTIQSHCRLQCVTFLQIIHSELVTNAYVYDTKLFWVARTGLPPLPLGFFMQLVQVVKEIFPHDRKVTKLCETIVRGTF